MYIDDIISASSYSSCSSADESIVAPPYSPITYDTDEDAYDINDDDAVEHIMML